MLTDGEGALFADAGDAHAIAVAVRSLAQTPQLRETMGQANRRAVEERFSFPRIAEEFDRLYRREPQSAELTNGWGEQDIRA